MITNPVTGSTDQHSLTEIHNVGPIFSSVLPTLYILSTLTSHDAVIAWTSQQTKLTSNPVTLPGGLLNQVYHVRLCFTC